MRNQGESLHPLALGVTACPPISYQLNVTVAVSEHATGFCEKLGSLVHKQIPQEACLVLYLVVQHGCSVVFLLLKHEVDLKWESLEYSKTSTASL